MAQTAAKYAGTVAEDASAGTTAWTNPTNAQGSVDATVAVAASAAGGVFTRRLKATNFGFTTSDVPTGSTINGFIIRTRVRGGTNNRAFMQELYVVKGGTTQTGATNLGEGSGTNWTNVLANRSYGGASQKFGLTWTVADVTDSGFGLSIQAGRSNTTTAEVAWYEVIIDYTPLVTHTTTGTPTADAATVAGTATHLALHPTSGALAAAAAEVAGTAAHVVVPKLYYVIGPSSGWSDPTEAEIKAGQLSGGGAATASGNEAAPTTSQTFDFTSDATGLTGGTSYKIAFVWSDGTNDSNVAVSDAFVDGGAGTHTTTGALDAGAATVAGTAAHEHAATGTLAASAATAAGTAVHLTLHTSTGALEAAAATVAGTAADEHATTGALASDAAAVAGTAVHLTLHTSSGALAAQAAAAAGAAAHEHATTGALAAGAATVAGDAALSVAATEHDTSGDLAAGAADVDGTAAHSALHATTGELAAGAATVAGTAFQAHDTTGALSAQAATLAGDAVHPHTTPGTLAAQAATAEGSAQRLALHTTSGALAAGAATVAGTALHAGGHATEGNLSAQAAAVVGAAVRLALHTATGDLTAGSATVSGSAAVFVAGGLSPKHARWLEALARAHGLIDPLTVSATQRSDGTLVQAVAQAGEVVTVTTQTAPSGEEGTSALTAEQAGWLEALVRLHGIIDPLTVTTAERGDGTLSQTIASAAGTTTVTRTA
jgi:hypothetical protein